jgi:outer membrane protein
VKNLAALIVALGLAVVPSAHSQAPAVPGPAGNTKVAVSYFEAALAQTNDGQRALADLKQKFEPKRAQFKTLSDEIESLTKQLQTDGAKLTNAERASKSKAIEDKKKKAQRFGEDAQNEYQQEMQGLYSGVASKVYDVLVAYAQQHGYSLVIDGGQKQAPLLLYADPATDISKDIVDAYNAKSGVPAAPAAPANPPAAH